jgi:hypothetical protein
MVGPLVPPLSLGRTSAVIFTSCWQPTHRPLTGKCGIVIDTRTGVAHGLRNIRVSVAISAPTLTASFVRALVLNMNDVVAVPRVLTHLHCKV